MSKPRIFLGSSGEQAKLLQAITRGLEDVADVEPWTTTFNPGRSTLDRLVELSQEVDFAAFVFAQDDWTTTDASQSGQASPRDNVVFEAGLFGGALGIRRTFILHANGSKLPSDLLGLTSVRYDPATSPAEVRAINQKLCKAIETEGRRSLVEGLWWQLSLTMRSEEEPSAVSLLGISRDRDGGLNVTGRAWQEDGTLSARYWSEAAKERRDPAGVFYFWRGERPRHPNAPELEGTAEIKVETADRATGYWTTRSDRDPGLNARTAGIYLRADPSDLQVLDGGSEEERAQLIAQRLQEWKVGRERILNRVARFQRRFVASWNYGIPVAERTADSTDAGSRQSRPTSTCAWPTDGGTLHRLRQALIAATILLGITAGAASAMHFAPWSTAQKIDDIRRPLARGSRTARAHPRSSGRDRAARRPVGCRVALLEQQAGREGRPDEAVELLRTALAVAGKGVIPRLRAFQIASTGHRRAHSGVASL